MKTVSKIILFVASTVLGLVVQIAIARDPGVIQTLNQWFSFIPGFQSPILKLEEPVIPGLIYLVCALITVSILTYIIRVFADTKNLKRLSLIVNIFVILIIGLPISALLLYYIDLYPVSIMEDSLVLGPAIRIIINCILFGIVFLLIILFFSKQYYEKLKRPRKRCKLEICEAVTNRDFVVKSVVLENYLFEQCFSAMRNHEAIQPKQFYRITEMNWNKKKEVDHWSYYQNGEIILVPEEEFLPKLTLVDSVKDVKWEG